MAEFPGGLVWLASYPKSGNTWLRILISNLLLGEDKPADINNLSEQETLLSRWRFADELLVDSDMLYGSEFALLRPKHCDFVAQDCAKPFFCKTHSNFWEREDEPILGTKARKALYIVRDPRDVVVSLSFHASVSIDTALMQMLNPNARSAARVQLPYLVGDWGSHVQNWTGQQVLDTKVVYYEDLHSDTLGTFRLIIDFLDGRATESEIERAVANSRFEELQRQEAMKGFRESLPGQDRFFRSGQVGNWRNVLTNVQVRRIEEQLAEGMALLHYDAEG